MAVKCIRQLLISDLVFLIDDPNSCKPVIARDAALLQQMHSGDIEWEQHATCPQIMGVFWLRLSYQFASGEHPFTIKGQHWCKFQLHFEVCCGFLSYLPTSLLGKEVWPHDPTALWIAVAQGSRASRVPVMCADLPLPQWHCASLSCWDHPYSL